jgi:hypothetical protein
MLSCEPAHRNKLGWEEKAADKWSIMMKHLLQESKNCNRSLDHVALGELLQSVRDHNSGLVPATIATKEIIADSMAAPASECPPDRGHETDAVAERVDQVGATAEEDVVFMGAACMCPACRPRGSETIDIDSEGEACVKKRKAGNADSDAESESSVAANVAPYVDPKIGGHKHAMQASKGKASEQKGDVLKKPAKASKKPAKASAMVSAIATGAAQCDNRKGVAVQAKMVQRHKGRSEEAYIMVSATGEPAKLWVGCTVKQSKSYLDIVKKIKQAVEEGSVTTKADAVEMRGQLLQAEG